MPPKTKSSYLEAEDEVVGGGDVPVQLERLDGEPRGDAAKVGQLEEDPDRLEQVDVLMQDRDVDDDAARAPVEPRPLLQHAVP